MSRNGSGVYTKVNTFTSGTPITAAGHNQNWDDIADEITNSVAADGQTSMTGPLKAASGTAAAPSHTFGSDPNTGAYRIGSDNYGIAVGGTKIVDVAATGVSITGNMDATTVKQSGFTLLPVGVIWPYGGSAAPSGYLLCDGSAVSRTTYAALFTAIGTAYGVGDGSTTFNVPDMKGRIPAGKEASASRLTSTHFGGNSTVLGATGGLESHTLTEAQLAAHDHDITDTGHTHSRSVQTPTSTTVGTLKYYGSVGSGTSTDDTASATTGITVNNAGGGSAHNNVQPTIIVNYIIFAGV